MKKLTALILLYLVILSGCGGGGDSPVADGSGTTSQPASSANLALNRTATSSSDENDELGPQNAVDGDLGTRWASAFTDPSWIAIDLGSEQTFKRVVLIWEDSYAVAYEIQVSDDDQNWTTVYTQTQGGGGIEDLSFPSTTARYIRLYGTQRATPWGYSLWAFEVYNNDADTGGDDGDTDDTGGSSPDDDAPVGFWDSSNIPAAQNVLIFKFLNRTNGEYDDSEIYWKFNGQVHSIAEQPYFDMPANSSGRMYFYLGSPDSLYYDFIEFTIGPTQFNGNTTRVDAFGIKLTMRLVCADGYDVAVGEDYSLFEEDRATTFQRFIDAVPEEFKHLAQIQAPYRIVEPGAGEFNTGGLYEDYYDAFVDELWANNGLTIAKPGPNGSGLGAYPDISAAIYRHVGSEAGTFSSDGKLLNHDLWKDSSTFYIDAPADYYAQFWHDNALSGRAYGFPYDDVGGYSTYISHTNPQYLLIAIGW